MKRALTFLILLYGLLPLKAQKNDLKSYLEREAVLSFQFDSLFNMPPGKSRDSLNEIIISSFEISLHEAESIYFPWKGLGRIGNLSTENPGLRVFTWSLKQKDGQYKYYGLIQYLKEVRRKKQEVFVYSLNDQSYKIKNPEIADLSAKEWYGALYFRLLFLYLQAENILYIIRI
jgi:hypothetical protein